MTRIIRVENKFYPKTKIYKQTRIGLQKFTVSRVRSTFAPGLPAAEGRSLGRRPGWTVITETWVSLYEILVSQKRYRISFDPHNKQVLFFLSIRIYPAKPLFGATLLPPRTCVLCRRKFRVVITVSFQDLRQETLKITTTLLKPPSLIVAQSLQDVISNQKTFSVITICIRNSILLYTILFPERTFQKSLLNPLALKFMCSKIPPKIKKEEYF